MSPPPVFIVVPPELTMLAWRWAKAVVEGYANGWKERSRSVSMLGAEEEPIVWARSRTTEIAFCIWANINHMTSLDWRTTYTDGGHDVKIDGTRLDLKFSDTQCLLWPLKKNGQFEDDNFDFLVLARITLNEVELCGWMTKDTFRERRRVSDGSPGQPKIAGTWFVHRSLLQPMETLLENCRIRSMVPGTIAPVGNGDRSVTALFPAREL